MLYLFVHDGLEVGKEAQYQCDDFSQFFIHVAHESKLLFRREQHYWHETVYLTSILTPRIKSTVTTNIIVNTTQAIYKLEVDSTAA